MLCGKFLFLLMFVVLVLPLVSSSSYDLNLTIIANDTLQISVSTSLFNVTNLDYSVGQPIINARIVYDIKYVNGTCHKCNRTLNANNFKKYKPVGTWTPNELGNFTICGNITNSTANDTNTENNFICKNISVIGNITEEGNLSDNITSENITVIEDLIILTEVPSKSNFGSSILLSVKFNTTFYDYDKAKFLIYGANQRIVTDLEGNKIKSYAECQGDTAIEIDNSKNQTYFLAIPFFLYPNCDDYYSDGEYWIALRVCRPTTSKWKKYDDYFFDLEITGKNSELCPEYQDFSESESSSTSGKTKSAGITYSITQVPLEIDNDNFTIKLRINNNEDKQLDFSVWSYLYRGPKCYSINGREGNKKEASIAPYSYAIIELDNKINATNGSYKIKIKILKERLKTPKEFTFNVSLKNIEKGEQSNIQPTKNESKKILNQNLLGKEGITGEVIYESGSEEVKSYAKWLFISLLLMITINWIIKNKVKKKNRR